MSSTRTHRHKHSRSLTLAPLPARSFASGVTTFQILLIVIIMSLMFGMGAATRVEDYINIARKPWAPLVGFICQFGLMPLLAVAVAEMLDVPGDSGMWRVIRDGA